jgi:hypothetical protein
MCYCKFEGNLRAKFYARCSKLDTILMFAGSVQRT